LSDYDAGVLANERTVADFFESAVDAGGEPKRVCNLITQVGLKLANTRGCSIAELGPSACDVAQLAKMAQTGEISATAANTILEEMVKTGKDPRALAEQLNLIQKSDAGELEKIVEEVLKDNPQAVEDFRAGGKKSGKARGFLLGQVMQKTKGRANPKVAAEILDRKIA
jgi:aspartyl-tRNA(Asn)/glutamyl-tRNA(Gln) amidotransferase subunit B